MNISNIYEVMRFSTLSINNTNIKARSDPCYHVMVKVEK